FFFFQAEDGIRDFHVTGVQTCALPILGPDQRNAPRSIRLADAHGSRPPADRAAPSGPASRGLAPPLRRPPGQWFQRASAGRKRRSEERRGGKGCGSGGVRVDEQNESVV